MFYCYLHQWSSHYSMCPVCQTNLLKTSTTMNVKEEDEGPLFEVGDYTEKEGEPREWTLNRAIITYGVNNRTIDCGGTTIGGPQLEPGERVKVREVLEGDK